MRRAAHGKKQYTLKLENTTSGIDVTAIIKAAQNAAADVVTVKPLVDQIHALAQHWGATLRTR